MICIFYFLNGLCAHYWACVSFTSDTDSDMCFLLSKLTLCPSQMICAFFTLETDSVPTTIKICAFYIFIRLCAHHKRYFMCLLLFKQTLCPSPWWYVYFTFQTDSVPTTGDICLLLFFITLCVCAHTTDDFCFFLFKRTLYTLLMICVSLLNRLCGHHWWSVPFTFLNKLYAHLRTLCPPH